MSFDRYLLHHRYHLLLARHQRAADARGGRCRGPPADDAALIAQVLLRYVELGAPPPRPGLLGRVAAHLARLLVQIDTLTIVPADRAVLDLARLEVQHVCKEAEERRKIV